MAASIPSEDGDLGFQIAPMVDVVFVLMLFFMACVSGLKMEKRLPFDLPSPGPKPGPVAIVIGISADGLVSLNDKVFAQPSDHQLNALREWFANTVATFGADDPVILRPSPDARHERIMEVLACASAAQVKHVSFN